MGCAYYNEIEAFAAAWLRELIKAGHIAPGEVDERSIVEVQPEDLRGFAQCHFFAGIGVWSHALRAAGWPDDSAVWTGSCPCQSFSASGKRGGFSDQRHLWPAWFRLIRECRPDIVFGEQVASKDGLAWFDVVSSDMEGAGYAVGAADTCAAGFGAPHIRQRLYFVADTQRDGRRADLAGREAQGRDADGRDCQIGGMADTEGDGRREERADAGRVAEGNRAQGWAAGHGTGSPTGELGHAHIPRPQGFGEFAGTGGSELPSGTTEPAGRTVGDTAASRFLAAGEGPESEARDEARLRGPEPGRLTNGFWRDAQWLWCRDGKYRPVEPGTFPLAHGAPARVGRLRGYGNAINAEQAKAFIEAYREG